MLGVKSSIIKEGLMLMHASIKRNIIIFAPSTKRMKEEDGVLITLLKELLTGIFEKKHVAIMKRVTHLESIYGISSLGLNGSSNL